MPPELVALAKKANAQIEAPAETNPVDSERPVTDWKVAARKIADECFDSDTKSGCRDSLAGYSRRVMDKMQQRKIHGPRGLIDNANTIQREALQGARWWANKPK